MYTHKKSPLHVKAKRNSVDLRLSGQSSANPFDSDDECDKKQAVAPPRSSSDPSQNIRANLFDEDHNNGTSSAYPLNSAERNRYKNDFRDSGGLEGQSVQELENYAVYKSEETTKTVDNCLKIAEDMRESATKTLVTMHQQGEQITRTHMVAADMDHDLSRGEKLLGSLGGLFSKTWKPKKNHAISGPVMTKEPTQRRGNHLEQRERLGLTSAPKERSSTRTYVEPTNALQKVEVEKSKQDDALSDLSNVLGELKDMAIDMGSEMDRILRKLSSIDHLLGIMWRGDKFQGQRLTSVKHRSSAKLSLQRWVGGLSRNKGNSTTRNRPSPSVKCGFDKCGGEVMKTGRYSVVHEPNNVTRTSHVSLDKNLKTHDKQVTLNNECLKYPVSTAENVELPHKKDEVGHEQKNKLSVPYKIRWGNLDDYSLHEHPEASVGASKPISPVEDNMLIHSKGESSSGSLSSIPATVSPKNVVVATEVIEKSIPEELRSVTSKENFIQDKCEEVNEIFSKDIGTKILNENVCDQDNAMASFEGHSDVCKEKNDGIYNSPGETIRAHSEDWVKLENSDYSHAIHDEDTAFTPTEDSILSQIPSVKCDSSCSKASGPPLCDGELCNEVLSHEPIILTCNQPVASYPEAPEVDDVEVLKHDIVNEDLSQSPNAEVTNAEGRIESKERFRHRLWCFLFENLNRSIDELYLLCELECDQEQVRESILVLEEAASDFKELNMRVEEFENVKKSTSHLVGGASMTMKYDHRRPHALSWEVRRMTTSPHKAEILSSSLEAFKKIQQDRVRLHANDIGELESDLYRHHNGEDSFKGNRRSTEALDNFGESVARQMKRSVNSDFSNGNSSKGKRNTDLGRCASNLSTLPSREISAHASGKNKKEQLRAPAPDTDKFFSQKDKVVSNNMNRNSVRTVDYLRKQVPVSQMEKERKNGNLWKSMDAWKEKRNWEDILASPHGTSARFSHSPGISRRSTERSRILHDKLMSPDKRKKSALDFKKEADEKHARAMRIRSELENERVQKLQRASEKLNRVNEWQAVRSLRMREVIHDRHRRSESRHEAFLAQVVRRAGDESSKVNEVRFITSLNEENKKLILRQKHQDSESRRAEKLQLLKTKQKEDMAREEAVLERRRLLEAEKLQRLAEIQRKKEEAQLRREEERRASTAAREAKAIEQIRRKEVRAKARQEEAELMAQKLAERLKESEQRRKFYLEQIREKASMDFRDQSSPLVRRSINKEGGRSAPNGNSEEYQANSSMLSSCGGNFISNVETEHALKRRIKRIRQKLMGLKHEFPEPSVTAENAGIGYRTATATARAKIGRWLQELQKLRQARKEGAASFGLISAEIMKFLDGRDTELHASRQAGLLDFIASALPASHSSKPEACQFTVHLLRLLRVALSMPENRGYFLSQNLLPPLIPMLVAAIENYIKIVASLNVPGVPANLNPNKSSYLSVDVMSDILNGFLWTVAVVIGHRSSDDRQLKMQDGLLELVVVYKVINRLRDLFALYDRRQVEGSPFPSSILLSINLLAVLTSKPRNVSSIDWELLTSGSTANNENKFKPNSSADVCISSPCLNTEDCATLSSTSYADHSSPLPHIPEGHGVGEFFKARNAEDTLSHPKSSDNNEVCIAEVKTEAVSDESTKFLLNDGRCSISFS
ncbi:hypothetical protein Leryth_001326 [Lithospermum erythrorhizon]|nr:hypothetical protein Leryth_001326 [Lithospermum erythrorhizon]